MNDSAVRCQSREELCPQAKSILLTSTITNGAVALSPNKKTEKFVRTTPFFAV